MENTNNGSSSKGLSIAALICGIVGLIGSWFPVVKYVAPIAPLVGLILAIIALKRAKQNNEPKGLAVAGLILSIVGLVLGVVIAICTVVTTLLGVGIAGCAGIGAAGSNSLEELLKQLQIQMQ